jgi:NAD(P)-dependent dehydrogenase (short-subunit alcohol dehydrogenase family)
VTTAAQPDGRPVALVTGSSRGIGRAAALLFAQRGHDVVVHFRREGEAAEAVAKEARAGGVEALVVSGDLQDAEVPGRILAETADPSAGSTCWWPTPPPPPSSR